MLEELNDSDNCDRSDVDVGIPVCQSKRNGYISACIVQVSWRRYFVPGVAISAQHCPRSTPSIL